MTTLRERLTNLLEMWIENDILQILDFEDIYRRLGTPKISEKIIDINLVRPIQYSRKSFTEKKKKYVYKSSAEYIFLFLRNIRISNNADN